MLQECVEFSQSPSQHLVNCYLKGIYSDFLIRTKGTLSLVYKLHKIIISKNNYLLGLIENDQQVIEINDLNITQKGNSC
jgi:hypothetical protein